MDADSSYGGSDTAQDSHSGHDNSSSLETTHNDVSSADPQQQEPNSFYHKNEITLPVNYDEADFQDSKPASKEPHYLSTANLNINDTLENHSNLEEMSKNYKSTSYLNESPRVRKKSQEGVDNPAFQEEEYKPEVKSTFDHNKPYNGDLNSSAMLGLASPNKNEEPLTEAVNLELINLKPAGKDVTGAYENSTNGMTSIPVKKENDAEIGNPYDEYFVPVNEHRKYMRGEKLYVTMDKRNKKTRNKCLCWGLCLCIVAAAVIIGILAAVGIIGNQGPHPIHEVSARHFGSATTEETPIKQGGIFGLPKDIINETTTQRLTPGPPLLTVGNLLPTTETSMIQVPRALESQIVIDNLQFSPALADKNSTEYKTLAQEVEDQLKNSLFSSDMLKYGSADIEVKVMDFTPGSVVVKYRITWVFKDGLHNTKDPIDEEMLQRKLRNLQDNENGSMDNYHIANNTMTVERILDLCKIENNGCEHNCSFDYQLADFVCSCPEGKYLSDDRKTCLDEIQHEHVHFYEHTTLHPEPEPSSEPEHPHVHYTTMKPEPEPEPTPEPEPSQEHDHHNTEPSAEPEPESIETHHHPEEASPEPEPTSPPEEASHQNYVHVHELEATPPPIEEDDDYEDVNEFEHNHEEHVHMVPITDEPKPEQQHHEEHVHILPATEEPEPEPTTEIITHNTEPVEPKPEPTQVHIPAVTDVPEPEPTTYHNIHEGHLYVSKPDNEEHVHILPISDEPKPEPTTEVPVHRTEPIEPESEPTAEHDHEEHVHVVAVTDEPKPEPTTDHIHEEQVHIVRITDEPKPEPTTQMPVHNTEPVEPKAEPTAEHDHEEHVHVVAVTDEPKPEPATEATMHNTEPTALNHETTPKEYVAAEPTPEPTVTTIKPIGEHSSPAPEPSPEPTSEPVPEPTSEPVHEHSTEKSGSILVPVVVQQESEHSTEPVPEPTSEPVSEHSTEKSGSILVPVVVQHSTEPVPEPTSEPVSEHPTEKSGSVFVPVVVQQEPEHSTEPAVVHNTEPAAEPIPLVPQEHNTEHVPQTTEHVPKETSEENHVIMAEAPQSTTSSKSDEAVTEKVNAETTTEARKEVSLMGTTTPRQEEEVRHNHLSGEIFAEHEITTERVEVTTLKSEDSSSTTSDLSSAGETHAVSSEMPTTTPVAHEENLIPVLVNEQPRLLHVDDEESSENATTTIPIYINDSPVNLPKNSTAVLTEETTTRAPNANNTVMESTENTSAMDNMSPFLPEIDNDTFVNKLHKGEHVIPHIQNETHDEETVETRRLDNDQMNFANAQETNDTALKVVPLEGNENEILDHRTETVTTTTAATVNVTEANHISQETASSETSKDFVPVNVEGVTEPKPEETTTEEVAATTLPSEILNNVHGNNHFGNSEESKIGTSTEDLIALETTTNREKVLDHITTEVSRLNQTATTIHAEMLDTVTESIRFDTNEPKDVTTQEVSTEENAAHLYEVKESVSDLTTTEKLFVTMKSTTENPILAKAEYEDLSVVPLDPIEDNEAKVNEKRVAHPLESDDNSVNDISEEGIVLDKFQHSNNDLHPTTLRDDEINPSTDSNLKYQFNRKNHYDEDKHQFEKKVKADDEILTAGIPSDQQPHSFSDIRPVTEEFEIPDFARCTYGQFHCVNGTSVRDGSYCIPESDRCDSVDDCSDASDEIDCVKNGCPNNFQCASGQCLKRHLVCDGIQNCNDGSDENGCDHWTCRFDEFSCGHGGRCLPLLWKCDGRSQCADGSDEHNCPSNQCHEDSFHCTEQNACVPKSWRCDGESDCMNGEDETSCKCGSDEFKCAIGGGCIKAEQTCDGSAQCADQSDEWDCIRLEKDSSAKKYLEIRTSNTTWYPVCSQNWNQTHSDSICRHLGYAGSSLTENVDKPDDHSEGYLRLKPQLQYGAPILSQLEKTDSCDTLVGVACQEFACGSHSTLDVQSARIIGGNRGVETQWPSLALLYNKRFNLQCTATLVSPIWAIASYSCIFDLHARTAVLPSDWILYAGSTNFFGNPDNSTTQVGQVRRILPHPQAKFSQFEYKNDVVLVELSKPLTITRNVSALCLPDKDIEQRQLCVIAGWGVSRPGEPSKNQYLHYLPVPIVDAEECNSTKHYNGQMTKDKICAGYTDPEKTPCYNDEGAPLMCFSDGAGTWELQGVLSHHDNCAKSKHPAIYTSINESMRKWVISTIGQKPARSA